MISLLYGMKTGETVVRLAFSSVAKTDQSNRNEIRFSSVPRLSAVLLDDALRRDAMIPPGPGGWEGVRRGMEQLLLYCVAKSTVASL